jgi:cyclase
MQKDAAKKELGKVKSMRHTLIVARIRSDAREEQIAEVFANSDTTELPRLAGVRARTLFRFHDLYMHLIEADSSTGPNIEAVRHHPLFQQVSKDLDPYIAPYDPRTWKSPADAMARGFYRWTAG